MTDLISALNGLSWPAALFLSVGSICGSICVTVTIDSLLTLLRNR